MELYKAMLKTPVFPLMSARVRQEVDALSVEERTAVMLVCVKGLSYQDAARKLGISPGMLQEHLLSGRLTLITKLSQKG